MEIKINDDGTALIDGVVYRKEEAEVKVEVNDNPLFYPKRGDKYCWLGGYFNEYKVTSYDCSTAPHDYEVPKLRPETAERVAWGMSRLAEWQAMGVGIGEEGEDRWRIFVDGGTDWSDSNQYKSTFDALFLTREDAKAALEKFGGFEALREARLARWGK